MKRSVGDKVWYVPYPNHIFAVLCTIKEVDEEFNVYWLDEPVGHGVQDDELLDTFEDVLDDLTCYMKENPDYSREIITLEKYRERKQFFIKSTWKRAGEEHPGFDPLPNKKEVVEWINLEGVER